MVSYIIIEMEIDQKGNFGIAKFDKAAFSKENNVYLNGDPINVAKENGKLILIFKGNHSHKKEEDIKDEIQENLLDSINPA